MNMGALVGVLGPPDREVQGRRALEDDAGRQRTGSARRPTRGWAPEPTSRCAAGGARRVGEDAVQQLAQEAGISEDEAADVLAAVVPQVVNGLTPNGRVPTDDEVDDFLRQFQPRALRKRNSPRATITAAPPTSTASIRPSPPSARAWRVDGRPIRRPARSRSPRPTRRGRAGRGGTRAGRRPSRSPGPRPVRPEHPGRQPAPAPAKTVTPVLPSAASAAPSG